MGGPSILSSKIHSSSLRTSELTPSNSTAAAYNPSPPSDLLVSTPRRIDDIEIGTDDHDVDPPTRIVVVSEDSNALRARMREIGFDYLIRRPVHREALRLLIGPRCEAWPAGPLRYRFQWTFPIAVSPHDHTKVYVGSQHVHQTTNCDRRW